MYLQRNTFKSQMLEPVKYLCYLKQMILELKINEHSQVQTPLISYTLHSYQQFKESSINI